jgi:hypothetical protein
MKSSDQSDFFQRADAAILAISARCSGVSLALRAAAPFGPPTRPRATAAGDLPSSTRSSTCPVAMSPMSLASAMGSRGRLRRFVVMT